jgi:AcrR family transcriptional regulator
MRADAARNLNTVLQTGARLLAEDPTTTIATIAAEAGVDRRTVYRRFASREALFAAVFGARLDAADQVFAESRLDEAPVAVALHRFIEGIVPVIRRYPLDVELMRSKVEAYDRLTAHRERFRVFVQRAVDEGFFRDDLPDGLARLMLFQIVDIVAREFPEIEPAEAADLVVHSIVSGIGRP